MLRFEEIRQGNRVDYYEVISEDGKFIGTFQDRKRGEWVFMPAPQVKNLTVGYLEEMVDKLRAINDRNTLMRKRM